jgi:hypothetical protein
VNISISAFCSKAGRTAIYGTPQSLSNPIGVSISYNDSEGSNASIDTTANESGNVSYSLLFADGTNLSLSIRLSPSSQNSIALSYTKSPGAALVLTSDSNGTADGAVRDYSPLENNVSLGGGNSSNAPSWLSSGCHSYGCYSFDGVSDFMNGSANFTGEAPASYSEATYGLNGGFEANSSATTFYNWVPVGNTNAGDFSQSSDSHSGSKALSANSANTSAYAYNNKAVLKNGASYSLEFWAKQSAPRFAVYDEGNGRYLSQDGSWSASLQMHNASAGAGYLKTSRNFRTLPSSAGALQLRFYAPENAAQTAKIDDVSLAEVSDFSFSFWVKSPASGGSAFYQSGSAGRFGATGFNFSASGGNITANISSDGISIAQRAYVGDSQWHHVALVANRTGNASLFLDGSLVSSSNLSIGTLNSSPNFTIGARNQTAGFFAGTLDEIRIYRRALSASEIRGHYYNRYQSPCSLNITVVYANASLASASTTAYYNANLAVRSLVPGAALYMPFDGNASSNQAGGVLDYSGYANTGTLGGGNSSRMPNWTANGKPGGAYTFDGIWGHIDVPFSQSLNITQNASLMARVYMLSPGDATHWTGIISKGNGQDSGQYELVLGTDGRPQFRGTAQNGAFAAPCNTNLNQLLNAWHFIATTFNGSQVRCYIDGSLDATVDNDGWAMPLVSASGPLAIGVRQPQSGVSGASHINGTIDEVRIYNRVLSAEEIDSIYKDTILIRNGPVVASAD